LLQKAVEVAEKWWNRRRLEVELPSTDQAAIALFESFDFAQEARLRQSVRIAGELVDDLVLARLSGDAARPVDPVASPPTGALDPSGAQPRTAPSGRAAKSGTRTESTLPMGSRLRVRGGSSDDWEALHTIWAQPTVYWGTMHIPYPSADRSRERIQDRAPPRFWPLMAEVDGTVVGSTGLHRGDHNRSHVGHIGMMVHTDYQGMGVGTTLLAAVIDLGENWLGLSRIQLEVYTDNTRAIGLYERHGLEEEGSLRAHSYRDGRYVDVLVMGRIRDG
jgi:putative acetyltransferase